MFKHITLSLYDTQGTEMYKTAQLRADSNEAEYTENRIRDTIVATRLSPSKRRVSWPSSAAVCSAFQS